MISLLAGKTAEQDMLVNVPRLVTAYYTGKPTAQISGQRVAFGTSGHRALPSIHLMKIILLLSPRQFVFSEKNMTPMALCMWGLIRMPCLHRHS